MKMKKFVSLMFVCLMLGGCSTTMTTYRPDGSIESTQPGSIFGPSSYDVGYRGMYQSWRDGQTERAKTIAKLPCPVDPVAAAYCNNSKMLGMAMMSMESFAVKAPTTGFDVLNHAVDTVVPVAGFVSLYKLGVAGITNAGSSFGNNATLSDSMNRTSQTSTAIGSGATSSGSAAGTVPQQVVTPEIVYPQVITQTVTP